MKKILMAMLLMPLMALAGSDLYMVVDLSGGATATKYPISFLSDVPEGGWTDEYKTTKLVLRRIEPGTCVVTVDKPYYAGVFEVTQKQYELITGTTPSYFAGNDKRPVEQVSYNMIRGGNKGSQYPSSTDVDDDSFMGKLRDRTGLQFDLPTEAQWEYACRAGTTTVYSYGDTANGDYMWYADNSGSCTHDVGTRRPNPWGLYDVHGNIGEWCLDWFPGQENENRIIRSGRWNAVDTDCTTSCRDGNNPAGQYYTYHGYGFRLCCKAHVMITDVKAQQRYPWNGKVDISYFATGIEAKAKEEGLMVSLKVAAIDQDAGTTNVATTLSGDMSLADGTHKIVWDMNAQGLDIKSTNVVFNVSCEEKQALYCVIDLSGGTTATSYPVSYLADVPSGGWTDEYKMTKLVLRYISPGSFKMGGTYDVTLTKGYYIGVFEVTQKQYTLVTGNRPSYAVGDAKPVEQVTWNTVKNGFIKILQEKTELGFDLPTDAQWEYACRAGTTTAYSYGSAANGDYMWYCLNSGRGTHEVGTRKQNAWGLYDMHGNVWEWCLDWYGPLSPGTDPEGPSSGPIRVLHGGSEDCYAEDCTSYSRYYNGPSVEFFRDDIGFRLSRTIK